LQLRASQRVIELLLLMHAVKHSSQIAHAQLWGGVVRASRVGVMGTS
jgi:hypothetical protein